MPIFPSLHPIPNYQTICHIDGIHITKFPMKEYHTTPSPTHSLHSLLPFRKYRKVIDTSDGHRTFGPVVIEYGKVQTKVIAKYDQWQKDITNKFATMLSGGMVYFYDFIKKVLCGCCMSVCVLMYVCMCMYECWCDCVCVYICVYVSVRMYVCVCDCVCVTVYVCVCL